MTMNNKTIAFIGAGNMAEALIRGLLATKTVPSEKIIATDVRAERLQQLNQEYGVRTASDNKAAVCQADVVVLAVKPQQMSAVLKGSGFRVQGSQLVISIAAGISTERIERELGGQPRVVRAMPNTPALVGAGAAAVCAGKDATEEDLATAEMILSAVGICVRVEESLMDAVTALSGSGPAYVFLVTEAMTAAGVKAGLNEELARKLAVQTVRGTGQLLATTGEKPEVLRQKVTSPGGTTAAALKVMGERKLMEIFGEAIEAAARRSRELSGS